LRLRYRHFVALFVSDLASQQHQFFRSPDRSWLRAWLTRLAPSGKRKAPEEAVIDYIMADKRAISPEKETNGIVLKKQKTETGAIAKTSATATGNVSIGAAGTQDIPVKQ